jgi:Nuclease-related domain
VPRPRPGTSGPDLGSIPRPAGSALRARLASDPRTPGWVGRGVASAVVGIIVSVLVNWRLGLTAAAVIAIVDTIHRSRVSAALPASLRAPSAHRRTRRRLARLSGAGYRTLHARTAPGSQCVIDHLVIGPGGVYTLDAERWDRRMPVVRATKGARLYHGPFSQADRLAHARQAADEASRLVSAALGEELAVQPAMVIYGPTVPWAVARISGVDVFGRRRLRWYLRQAAKARPAVWLGAEQIERTHAAATEALPPAR